MTTIELANKKSFLTKKGELRNEYSSLKWEIDKLTGLGKVHPIYWANKGSRLVGENRLYNLIFICDCFKIKYTLGNDAPRGGQEGRFMAVNHPASRKKLKRVFNELMETIKK